jgi:hypothetical protein
VDATESKRLRKEQDDLLWAVDELHTEHDSAHQERVDAHQQIDRLLCELEKERELKIKAKDMTAWLAMEISRR